MRIRSIKPEFWRSDDVTVLDVEDRLLFIGLWSYVDDNGVGLDKLAAISADLFANDLERDSSETFARVSRGLQNLFEAGRIVRYEADGKRFLYVVNWEKHQRIDKPNKERFPLPTRENTTIREIVATPSRDTRDTLAPGTEEQRNRGTEEQRNKTSSSEVAIATPRHDVEALLQRLDEWIIRNGGKQPTRSKKNTDAMRLMLDRDGIPPEQISLAIDWCQQDEFWRANILSASKLREKYDQLRLAAKRQRSSTTGRPTRGEENLAMVARMAAYERTEQVILGA